MPHIYLPEGLPGISAGFAFRPETAKPMRELAHILLHEPSSLSPGERELIATFEKVKANFVEAPITPKLKGLLVIAEKVRQDGKLVTVADVQAARSLGATDLEIHDTVLIAAAFSMYNRYVDGLGTVQPADPGMYAQMGKHLAEEGYTKPSIRQPVNTV
jgi:alkylhydroperoxidase/carboxymuconolactone decarboxylase family protein YurZ